MYFHPIVCSHEFIRAHYQFALSLWPHQSASCKTFVDVTTWSRKSHSPHYNFHQCRLPRVFSFSKEGVRLSGDFACLSAATSVVTFQKLSPSYHQHEYRRSASTIQNVSQKIPPLPKNALQYITCQLRLRCLLVHIRTDWHVKVERFGKICKSQRLQKCFVASLLICNPMAAENTSGQIKVERRLPKVFSLPTLLCAKYFILTNSTSIDKQMKMVKLGINLNR